MGATSQALAQGSEYSYGGRVYGLAPFDFDLRGAFEQYLERLAFETYAKVNRRVDPEAGDRLLLGLTLKLNEGYYSWGSEGVGNALKTPRHIKYAIFLQVKRKHPEVSQDLIEEMARADWEGLMRASNQANADPNLPKSEATKTETTTAPASLASA